MKYPILLLLPLLGALASCSTTGDGGDSSGGAKPSYPWPKSKGKTSISNTVIIRGSTKDYGMKTVDGSRLSGDGGQAENQEAPFDLTGSGSKLRKAIADSWPESIHVHGDNALIEDIYIPNVGEDAVTSFAGVNNLTIRNCAFKGAEDKIIQINAGGNILIENCYFEGFRSAIRVKKGTGKVTIKNCTFVDGTGAVVLDKGVSKPTITDCGYYNIKYKLRQD